MVESHGFRSTGRDDEVICCCSIRFRKWKTTSDLIRRHEVVKESCSFRERELTTQDDDFVSEPVSDGTAGVLQTLATRTRNLILSDYVATYQFLPMEIEARLDTTMNRWLINDIGFDENAIRQFIKRKLEQTGDDYRNTRELVLNIMVTVDESANQNAAPL